MNKIFLAIALVLLALVACQPKHPDRLADTLINNACHFNFDCCTPAERALLPTQTGDKAVDKAACIEELHDTFGGAFNVASAAVAAGKAVYDEREAERCSIQAAIDSCDAQTVLGGADPFTQLLYGIDASDTRCLRSAGRAFTRGLVKDGGACTSSFDCADFGTCNITDPTVAIEGTCRAPAQAGESCVERLCGLDLRCEGAACVPVVVLDNGAACVSDGECGSGRCALTPGVCSLSGEACAPEQACPDVDVGDNCTGVCAEPEAITIEFCDGL
jgi:hypothetical protein